MYEPIVFLKQPYTLRGSISFGNKSISSDSFENPSRIEFDLFADVLNSAKLDYGKLSDVPECPREILKFAPPPQNRYCDQIVYHDLTTLHDYGLNVTFFNVSKRENLYFVKQFSNQFSKLFPPK